jgi:hypothetical protein
MDELFEVDEDKKGWQGRPSANQLEHPDDYDRSGFIRPMLLPEVAEFLGVGSFTAKMLMEKHRVPASGLYGGYNRRAVRALKEVLESVGRL